MDAATAPTVDSAATFDAATAPTVDASAGPKLDGSASYDASDTPTITGPINRYLSVSPTRIDLGFVPPGTTTPPQTITVTVKEDIAILDVYSFLPSNDMPLDSTCGQTMAAGTSCTVVVTFHANATGTWHGLAILDANHDPLSVLVSAQVQNPGQLVINPSNPQEFNASPGNTGEVTFQIFNSGDALMGPLSIAISGNGKGAFTATPTGCDSIAKGAACAISVVYHPSGSAGSIQNASLDVSTSAPYAQSVSVPLGGSVSAPH
jgi:hypothetical protein